MGQKEEKEILLLRFLLQAVKMKLLIAMKSVVRYCVTIAPSTCPCAIVVAGEGREGDSSIFVHSSFFPSVCAPVLVLVMGKEAVHGGTLNKKAFSMADYLKKAGY